MDQKEYLKHMMLRTNVPTGNEKKISIWTVIKRIIFRRNYK